MASTKMKKHSVPVAFARVARGKKEHILQAEPTRVIHGSAYDSGRNRRSGDESEFRIYCSVKYPGQYITAGSDFDIWLWNRFFCQCRITILSNTQRKVTLEVSKHELNNSGKALKCCPRFGLLKANG